jgi:hypothetical protein
VAQIPDPVGISCDVAPLQRVDKARLVELNKQAHEWNLVNVSIQELLELPLNAVSQSLGTLSDPKITHFYARLYDSSSSDAHIAHGPRVPA